MSTALTREQFIEVLPDKFRKTIDQTVIDNINKIITDPIMAESYRDNLLGFSNVLKEGKYKLEQYTDAVRYVSFKMHGDSNDAAYKKTFPDRHQRLIAKGVNQKDIAAYVHAYSRNKIVVAVLGQALTPTHIVNADYYQEAINTQVNLMRNARSEKVKSDAADSVMRECRPPEASKIELDLTIKEDDSITELRKATLELAAQQRQAIQAGALNAKQAAESRIIAGEFTREDDV